MAKKITYSECKGCGKRVLTSTMKIFSGKKYFEECSAEKEKEVQAFKDLCTYIYEDIYRKDCNMPHIMTQIKKLKNEFNFTNTGMLTTLKYVVETEQCSIINLDENWGVINLITRYYEEARKFSEQREKINTDEELIKKVFTSEPVYVIMKRSDILERQKRADEERRRRYGTAPPTEEEAEEIYRDFLKYGTRETGIVEFDKGDEDNIDNINEEEREIYENYLKYGTHETGNIEFDKDEDSR